MPTLQVIAGLKDQVHRLQGQLQRPRCNASTQTGSSRRIEAGCQATAATTTSSTQTAPCKQPSSYIDVMPSKAVTADVGTQVDQVAPSIPSVKPPPAASEEQPSSESLRWDLQVRPTPWLPILSWLTITSSHMSACVWAHRC